MRGNALGIGTALVDHFVKVDDNFLKQQNLIKGATNFLPWTTFDEIYRKLRIFLTLPGDNARNVCEGVTYLGGSASYVGCVGEDVYGDLFLRELKSLHIHPLVKKVPGRTGRIIVAVTPDGERTFLVNLGVGVNCRFLPEKEIYRADFIYLTSITLTAKGRIRKTAERAVAAAGRKNVKVALSLESPTIVIENRGRLLELIDHVDLLFSNESELEALGKSVEWILRRVDLLYLKRGRKGSTVFTREKKWHLPCFSKRTVDTTGAGDFYAAGVIYGLTHGKTPRCAGELGAKLAARVVEHFGATLKNTVAAPKETQSIDRSP